METRGKFLLGASVVALATIGLVFGAATIEKNPHFVGQEVWAGAKYAYGCNSVHFGMSDTDHTGKAYVGSTGLASGTSIGVVGSDLNMTSYTVAKIDSKAAVYRDPTVCESIKLASGNNGGKITFTFDKELVGCTVYAIGWKGKTCSMQVNGQSTTVTSDNNVTGTSGYVDVTYYPYSFEFEPTYNIEIVVNKNNQTIIGDIALRVKA